MPDLFTTENPKPGEKGYLEKGFHFNKKGEVEDEKGNIYNEYYQLMKEAPSEAYLAAKRLHPGFDDDQLRPYVKMFEKQIETAKKNEKHENTRTSEAGRERKKD